MDERPLPEQRSGGSIDAHELRLCRHDDLARAAEIRDDRRCVTRTIAGPAPADLSGGEVERRQRALVLPPTWKITRPPSTSGENEWLVYSMATPVPGFCQT